MTKDNTIDDNHAVTGLFIFMTIISMFIFMFIAVICLIMMR